MVANHSLLTTTDQLFPIHKRTWMRDLNVLFRPPSVWHIRYIGTPINYTSMERASDFQKHGGSLMSLPQLGRGVDHFVDTHFVDDHFVDSISSTDHFVDGPIRRYTISSMDQFVEIHFGDSHFVDIIN